MQLRPVSYTEGWCESPHRSHWTPQRLAAPRPWLRFGYAIFPDRSFTSIPRASMPMLRISHSCRGYAEAGGRTAKSVMAIPAQYLGLFSTVGHGFTLIC